MHAAEVPRVPGITPTVNPRRGFQHQHSSPGLRGSDRYAECSVATPYNDEIPSSHCEVGGPIVLHVRPSDLSAPRGAISVYAMVYICLLVDSNHVMIVGNSLHS